MSPTTLRDCTTCQVKDRIIFIVGTQRFSTEILASYIGANTPANWQVVKRLHDIPDPGEQPDTPWRVIFLNCHGLADSALLNLLHAEAADLIKHDILALFNLARSNAIISDLLELGVRGFFYEDDPAETLLKGICALKSGELWATREVMTEFIIRQPRTPNSHDHAYEQLTHREKDILALIATGASNEAIASRLYISLHTVKTHTYNIFKKINVQNRLLAALWAGKHLK